MKVGARNQLIGEITEIKRGAVMGEVKLTIPAGSPMASVMLSFDWAGNSTAIGIPGAPRRLAWSIPTGGLYSGALSGCSAPCRASRSNSIGARA